MQDLLAEMVQLTMAAQTTPTATALPGVLIIKGEVPERQLAALYEPMVGLVVQGGKTLWIGDTTIELKAASYFVIPTELPATGRVHQGANGLPYVSVGLYLNQDTLVSLLNDLPEDLHLGGYPTEFAACDATQGFLEAVLRMLRLLKTPEHIAALAPVYEREILYRVITGPQGWRLAHLCRAHGKGRGIERAIQWIRENYTGTVEIHRMAEKAGMAVTTFHRQFRQMTGLTPIQFQKQLRLMEARKLLAFSGYRVAPAAYEVGYESASQFNREYARFFGAPPARDVARMKQRA
jgi:AraC-like DNA-binding protein